MPNLNHIPYSVFQAACENAPTEELRAFLYAPRESEGFNIRTPRTTGDIFDEVALKVLDAREEAEFRAAAPHERTPEYHTN